MPKQHCISAYKELPNYTIILDRQRLECIHAYLPSSIKKLEVQWRELMGF